MKLIFTENVNKVIVHDQINSRISRHGSGDLAHSALYWLNTSIIPLYKVKIFAQKRKKKIRNEIHLYSFPYWLPGLEECFLNLIVDHWKFYREVLIGNSIGTFHSEVPQGSSYGKVPQGSSYRTFLWKFHRLWSIVPQGSSIEHEVKFGNHQSRVRPNDERHAFVRYTPQGFGTIRRFGEMQKRVAIDDFDIP